MHMYDLDLLGTFAFAVFGAYKALEKRYNLYGVLTCAALTALGGGTIRETLLHHLPRYFSDHTYLYITIAGAITAAVLYRRSRRLHRFMLVIDAIGLATFALIGAQKAGLAGLGLVGAVFFASLTAAGGGILTDILTHNRPKVFTDDLYILPAALAGALYYLTAGTARPNLAIIFLCLLTPLAIRIGWLVHKRQLILPSLLFKLRTQISLGE